MTRKALLLLLFCKHSLVRLKTVTSVVCLHNRNHLGQKVNEVSLHFLGLLKQSTTDWVAYYRTTDIYYLILLEPRSQKSKCWLGHTCSETWRRNLPCLFWCLSSALGVPWLVDASLLSHDRLLPMFAHCLPTVLICVYVRIPPFYKDTNLMELGPTLITSF